MNNWNYGDSYLRYPISAGEKAVFDNGSIVQVHDIYNTIPDFMKQADILFVDSPWNLGNLRSFYTKAELACYETEFANFYKRLFQVIAEIAPSVCYMEVGKEFLGEFLLSAKRLYHTVTFYNSTYYHKHDNYCYVIRASKKRQKLPLDGLDEEDIIMWLTEHEEYDYIADPCIGRGLVAIGATKAGKRFVGTELNNKRLSVLIERMHNLGLGYTVKND